MRITKNISFLSAFFLSFVFLLLPAIFVHAATLDIVNGALTFTDSVSENNNVMVQVGSGPSAGYSFNDSVTNITLGAGAIAAGWRGSGTHAVSGLASTVTTITINPGDGI